MKMTKHIPNKHLWLLMIILTFFVNVEIFPAKVPTGKLFPISDQWRTDIDEKAAITDTTRIVKEIIAASFPELQNANVEVKTFESGSDYFRSQFSFSRFATFRRLHYVILVNPQVFMKRAPIEGVRAIISHELAHALYYRNHNRLELLGLVRLTSKSFTARFERAADLESIKRGYGPGLKIYREWLYKNIPDTRITEKRRNYFSPEEIDLILESISRHPQLIGYWLKKVPRNIQEIKSAADGKTLK